MQLRKFLNSTDSKIHEWQVMNEKMNRMYDFPVIGDLVMCTELWDRQGANIASRYKEMYGVELFLRLKPVSLDRECRILP